MTLSHDPLPMRAVWYLPSAFAICLAWWGGLPRLSSCYGWKVKKTLEVCVWFARLVAFFSQAGHIHTSLSADTSLRKWKIEGNRKKYTLHCCSGGIPSLLSVSCLGQLFSPPCQHANGSEPRKPRGDVHSAWEKQEQGMIFHFFPSFSSIASLACWELRNHTNSRSGACGNTTPNYNGLLEGRCELTLGLGDWLGQVVKWLHPSGQRSLWIHQQQFQH